MKWFMTLTGCIIALMFANLIYENYVPQKAATTPENLKAETYYRCVNVSFNNGRDPAVCDSIK